MSTTEPPEAGVVELDDPELAGVVVDALVAGVVAGVLALELLLAEPPELLELLPQALTPRAAAAIMHAVPVFPRNRMLLLCR